ncbi:PRC-barrel domain-containing protein, partial [Ameyamaea chiangmaiensis]
MRSVLAADTRTPCHAAARAARSGRRRDRLRASAVGLVALTLMAAAPETAVPPTAQPAPGGTAQYDTATGDQPELQSSPQVVPAPVAPAQPLFATRTMKLVGLIDREVVGPGKEQVGRVIDVLLDDTARPVAVVVDAGGFMGVGNRRIAIAWDMIVPASLNAQDSLQVRLKAEAIRAAPAYAPDADTAQVVQPPPP